MQNYNNNNNNNNNNNKVAARRYVQSYSFHSVEDFFVRNTVLTYY